MKLTGQYMAAELSSQPEMWRKVLDDPSLAERLPQKGEKVAIIGCGTSWFIGQAYASWREAAGHGVTDAFAGSQAPLERDYDRVIALSRSGTTTEVIEALHALNGRIPTIGIVGERGTPVLDLVDTRIELPFADEQSVVQTRFATTAAMLLRSSVEPRETLEKAIREAEEVLAGFTLDEPEAEQAMADNALIEAQQYTFVGMGGAYGLVNEAALKMRESCQAWTESYLSMDYRHGPIAIAAPGRVTWQFGPAPEGLRNQVEETGARFEHVDRDPMAELVRLHAVALTRARRAGLDPDNPRSLTRSVVLGDVEP